MDINFSPICLSDKTLIESYTHKFNSRDCDLAFSNIISWSFLYKTEIAEIDGFLLFKFITKHLGKDRIMYMFPIGDGDIKEVLDKMEEDAIKNTGESLMMLGVHNEDKQLLEEKCPDEYFFFPNRNFSDYIYLKQDLIELKGKKFQAHRNHINKFKSLYNYTFEPFTKENIEECLIFENEWVEKQKGIKNDEEIDNEHTAICNALSNFQQLDIIGGIIRVDGKIVAFSFGTAVCKNTFVVHVEKGDIDYDGVYRVINQEFAKHLPENFIYLNREEDMGIEGLRRVKIAYQPVFILDKWAAVRKFDFLSLPK
ncbi:MAG: phosphatidylglycerol lysyltransferase domain-containing protein [Bacteroidales bacterium]|nr:phosphatidylglycerol lysyltransferase domain-containing protein [Bacteroidales bacterium]